MIEEYGFRWALISKGMNGTRNEHMVKNRYNSLLKRLRISSNISAKRRRCPEIAVELMDTLTKINSLSSTCTNVDLVIEKKDVGVGNSDDENSF